MGSCRKLILNNVHKIILTYKSIESTTTLVFRSSYSPIMPKETMKSTSKPSKRNEEDTKKTTDKKSKCALKRNQPPPEKDESDEDIEEGEVLESEEEDDDGKSEEWITDEDTEESEDNEDDIPVKKHKSKTSKKSTELDSEEFHDFLVSLFKKDQKTSRKRIMEESDESEEEAPRRKSKRICKDKKKVKKDKQIDILDPESSDSDSESDEDYDDDAKDKDQNIMIILGGGSGGANNTEDGFLQYYDDPEAAEIEEYLNNENDDCNSEDEKTFMKEDYQQIDCPKEEVVVKSSTVSTDKKSNKKSKQIDKDVDDSPKIPVEDEYKELIDLKKHLSEKLSKNPHSKILIRAMKDCRESINKLVKKSRSNNAKDYYKLIKTETKTTASEIDYFKLKLSHKEQVKIMKELEIINGHINIDKPYRLSLLQTNLPAKYKATVMQKLNVMRSMEPGESEYNKMKTWVDGFMRVPFNVYKSLSVNMGDGLDVCDKFMRNARTQLDECVYGLDDAKLQIMQLMGQWVTNPSAMGSAIAIHGPPGTGKCFAINTPILMHDGSIKNVQDVIVGDVLMGDDSNPRNVLGLGSGKDEMYDIIAIRGEKYTVNSEHILSLKPSGLNRVRQVRNMNGTIGYKTNIFNCETYRMEYKTFHTSDEATQYVFEKSLHNEIVDISVKDYLELSENIKDHLKGYKTGVEFQKKQVMFDPYIVGVWLGDGSSAKSEITNQDCKILHYLMTELKKYDMKLSYMYKYQYGMVHDLQQPGQYGHGKNIFRNTLKHYNLWNNKHIPVDYKINDRETRLQLLAGLLDTDGYYDTRMNTFEITQKNKILSDDILFLARSLGFYASQSQINKSCMYKNEKRTGTYYRIFICGDGLCDIPTKCDRKRATDRIRNKSHLVHAIKVIPVGRGDYYGFEIDGNRRFVLGNFTVAHNTQLAKEGISKILGREFAFITLGGAGDSSFLEGHSYTYEGSMWGKIVQILMESKCMNPVIFFDELDKLSDSAKGQELTGILTHLTDTTQNNQFHDKYFSEVDFDISKCLFIFSYNDETLVNPILKDRMYRIKTKGYDCAEKVIIANKYILPKIREQVNFQEGEIIIPDETLKYIISNAKFTHNEEGVRNLKRCLEVIYTKLNLFRLMHPTSEGTDKRHILGKDVDLKVSFPFTVTKREVDILIRNDDHASQSLLAMYV